MNTRTRKQLRENREFWDKIILRKDGTVNMTQLYRELSDFSFMMEQVPLVYCHVTGGILSKPNYYAKEVIALADRRADENLESWHEDDFEAVEDILDAGGYVLDEGTMNSLREHFGVEKKENP